MFDGSARSSSRTARSSSFNNKAFVEETKRLRLERALSKRRDSSCLKIQCAVRGHATRKRVFAVLYADLEKKIADVQKLRAIFAAQKASFLLPLKILAEMSSIYYHLRTYSPVRFERSNDYDSFRLFVYDSFAESLTTVAPEYNMLREISSTAQETPTKRSLQFLLVFVMESLSLHIATSVNSRNSILLAKAFTIFEFFFSNTTLTHKTLVAYSSRTLKTFSWLLKRLLSKDGNDFVATDTIYYEKMSTIIRVVALAVTQVDSDISSSSKDQMFHDIAVNLLSIPDLHQHYTTLESVLRVVFDHGRNWFFFVPHIKAVGQQPSSCNANVSFVANLVSLSSSSACTQSDCIQLLSTVDSILNSIPLRRYLASLVENTMDVVDESMSDDAVAGLVRRLERELAAADTSSSSSTVDIEDGAVRESIATLFRLLEGQSMSIFINLIRFDGDVDVAASSVAILLLVVSIFKKVFFNSSVYYSQSSNGANNRGSDFISQKYIISLAFSNISDGIAKKIFDFLKYISIPYVVDLICYDRARSNDVVGAVNAASSRMYQTEVVTKALILDSMCLFSIVLNKILEGVDDFELFDQHIIFTLSEIKDVIFLYKLYIFNMLWVNPIINIYRSSSSVTINNIHNASQNTATTTNIHYLLSAVTLFNSLYMRNERRRILHNDSDWLAGGVGAGDLEIDADLINHKHSAGELETTFLFKNLKIQVILELVPQMISFDNRVTVFNNLLLCDKAIYSGGNHSFFDGLISSSPVTIMRSNLLEDAFAKLSERKANMLKKRIQIEFVADDGTLEPGIDGGGLFKSFMDSFGKTAFDPANGLFVATATNLLTPNHCSHVAYPEETSKDLRYLSFIGTMLARAIYEKILLEPHFCGCFLNRLLGRFNSVDDMIYMDTDIHKSLMTIKHTTDEATLESLDLHFDIEVDSFGDTVVIELQRGGSAMKVDRSNVGKYVNRYSNYKLNKQAERQTNAFINGFKKIIQIEWLRMFNIHELQLLVSGDERKIDISDMRAHCVYSNGYAGGSPYMIAFWEVVNSFSITEQCQFLKFITGCSRLPLQGCRSLYPQLCVQKVPTTYDNDRTDAALGLLPHSASRLPSASTCVNLLKLPQYATVAELRAKLLFAIANTDSFELS